MRKSRVVSSLISLFRFCFFFYLVSPSSSFSASRQWQTLFKSLSTRLGRESGAHHFRRIINVFHANRALCSFLCHFCHKASVLRFFLANNRIGALWAELRASKHFSARCQINGAELWGYCFIEPAFSPFAPPKWTTKTMNESTNELHSHEPAHDKKKLLLLFIIYAWNEKSENIKKSKTISISIFGMFSFSLAIACSLTL